MATNLAGQITSNLNETLNATPRDTEVVFSYTGGESADPVTAMHKRNIASQWGLDVYSTNPKVQEFLNAVARARSAGIISSGSPLMGVRAGKSIKVINPELESGINALLKSKSIADLNLINNKLLEAMNIRQDIRAKFLQHAIYSPRHKTRITHYLNLLDGVRNRSAFIEASIGIEDESMALTFEEAAMMLAYYHQHIISLQKLYAGNELLQIITSDNRIVYLAPVDIIYWSERTERLFDGLLKKAGMAGFSSWELVTAGILTREARSQLKKRKFLIREDFIN
ncbi:MAG: hypothetical protein ACE5GZ_00170 [Gammaproteobacteria bacterium]